jgi:hypothetical protein
MGELTVEERRRIFVNRQQANHERPTHSSVGTRSEPVAGEGRFGRIVEIAFGWPCSVRAGSSPTPSRSTSRRRSPTCSRGSNRSP